MSLAQDLEEIQCEESMKIINSQLSQILIKFLQQWYNKAIYHVPSM